MTNAATPSDPPGPVADLALPSGTGPLWGLQSDELNATLLAWPPGGGVAAHRNDECDVIAVVLAGSAVLTLDGAAHELAAGQLALLPRGSERSLVAGSGGVRYVSLHRRRGPLLPQPRRSAASAGEEVPCAGPSS